MLAATPPEDIYASDMEGWTGAHFAAQHGHTEALSAVLQAGGDAAATAVNIAGLTPLHVAALNGQPAAAALLVAAAPQAAQAVDFIRRTPLACALQAPHSFATRAAVALCLLAAGPARHVLSSLSASMFRQEVPRTFMYRLYADLVIARPALTADEWELVPTPCPGLGRALPAALKRSAEQAARLVARLPRADKERLRAFALALHRAQARGRTHLPWELKWRVLALFDS